MPDCTKVPPVAARRRSLCGDCILENVCTRAKVTVPSEKTIRKPEARLVYQNYLVGLRMPYRALIDFQLHAIRDFLGRFEDEAGNTVPAPGIAALLNPGAEFWYRDTTENGAWRSIADVTDLRSQTVGRWRIAGTVRNIAETVQPMCPPR